MFTLLLSIDKQRNYDDRLRHSASVTRLLWNPIVWVTPPPYGDIVIDKIYRALTTLLILMDVCFDVKFKMLRFLNDLFVVKVVF